MRVRDGNKFVFMVVRFLPKQNFGVCEFLEIGATRSSLFLHIYLFYTCEKVIGRLTVPRRRHVLLWIGSAGVSCSTGFCRLMKVPVGIIHIRLRVKVGYFVFGAWVTH